jgi:hypothetical protein
MTPVLWWFAALTIAVAVHETGHLLCARIASIPVVVLSVGVGPRLLGGQTDRFRWELRALPLGGFVVPEPVAGVSVPRLMLFVLGGVFGNAALIGVVAVLDFVGVLRSLPFANEVLGPLVFAQFVAIVTNLIPFRARLSGTRVQMPSDGLQLVRLIRDARKVTSGVDPVYAGLVRRYGAGEELRPSPAAPRITQLYVRSYADGESREDIRDALRHELISCELPSEEEMLVLDWLVSDGLIFGDSTSHSRLDEWSHRALQLGPEIETIIGSRGAVLVKLGRYQSGKALLERAAARDRLEPHEMVMNDMFLARAEHALGNTARAHYLIKSVRRAIRAEPASPGVMSLIARIEAEVGGG